MYIPIWPIWPNLSDYSDLFFPDAWGEKPSWANGFTVVMGK
jgi:hypothetical protein